MRYFIFFVILAAGCTHAPVDSLTVLQIQDRNGLTETISTPDRLDHYRGIDFLTAQPYKKILRVYRNQGKNHSKITTYHPNGAPWQYLEAEELRAHGAFKEWYASGQQKIDATVIGGTADVAAGSQHDWLFDGLSQVWDEQGRLTAKIPYKQGSLEGTSLYFYASGQIEKEIPYAHNLVEGNLIEYYPNGKIRSKTAYVQGNQQGPSTGYFQNGQLNWSEEYVGNLILTGSYYNAQGELISSVADGLGFRAVFEGDVLSLLIQIHQGMPEGGVKQFSKTGDLVASYHVRNGRKLGEEISYFLPQERTDGKIAPLPKLSVNWHENAIHGSVKTWYPTGQLQSQREFCRNKRMGPSLSWYLDGSLMLLEEYEEDRLLKGQYYKKNALDASSSVVNGNGTAMLFDENGVFMRKVTYVKGEPVDPE